MKDEKISQYETSLKIQNDKFENEINQKMQFLIVSKEKIEKVKTKTIKKNIYNHLKTLK